MGVQRTHAFGCQSTHVHHKPRQRRRWSIMARDAISDAITEATGLEVSGSSTIGSSGWSSQQVYKTADGHKFFVKTARQPAETMFRGEALGLQAMYDTRTLRVPEVICYGDYEGGSYLVTEFLRFGSRGDQAEMGHRLAMMHKATPKGNEGNFGFYVDNTIGGTPQPNPWTKDWVTFFREHRLRHQLRLLGRPAVEQLAQPVLDNLDVLFEDIAEDVQASVLHGDLWSGNIASVDGEPAVFDPAVYFGHSEADFGMSWCAAFSKEFYDAYFDVLPKQPGFDARRDLYVVYHYLNHTNLFGSGYLGETERLLRKLVQSVKRKS